MPPLVQATERFAEQIGVAVEIVSGHHAPYLSGRKSSLRPILWELV
jgi:hypothetical protein